MQQPEITVWALQPIISSRQVTSICIDFATTQVQTETPVKQSEGDGSKTKMVGNNGIKCC